MRNDTEYGLQMIVISSRSVRAERRLAVKQRNRVSLCLRDARSSDRESERSAIARARDNFYDRSMANRAVSNVQ